MAAIDRGDCDKAIEILADCLTRARQFAKDAAALKKGVAELKATKGDPAGSAYEKTVAKLPTDLRDAIASLVLAKRYDRALGLIAGLGVEADRARWTTHSLHLMALGKAERQAEARTLAEKWVADMPGELEARKLLIGELSEAKKWDAAAGLLNRWKADPLFAQPTTASAEDRSTTEDSDPAQWLAETAVRVRFAAGKLAEALKLADEAVRQHPKNAELLTLRSSLLGELGRDDEAEKVMGEALKIAPTGGLRYPTYLNNMAYLLAVRARRLGEAERFSLLSLRLRPRETASADTLGWVFYKQGRVLKAARAFQALLRQVEEDEPGSSVIFDHAADAYWRLGWRDRAVELWQKAIELGRKAENPGREERELIKNVPKKIEAAKAGRTPEVAPLSDTARPQDFLDLRDRSASPAGREAEIFRRWG
jgi:Flp pilus assembly protein TadD